MVEMVLNQTFYRIDIGEVSMEIYGHKLPDELYALIKDKGRDDLPFISVATLRKLVPEGVKVYGGFFGGMQFSDVEGIKSESELAHLLDLGDIYGIGSSKHQGKPITDLHILDADKALTIAVNHDEETIALDYRIDPLNPRVLGSFLSFIPRDWVLLADSFAEFLEKIDL
jgi:hypothetical protein